MVGRFARWSAGPHHFCPIRYLARNDAIQKPQMKREYDFSRAERGKFFRANATLRAPVYLDRKVQRYLAERAKSKGVEVSDLVNQMLKHDIEMVERVR